ncbi:MAG: c-type cytochrome [Pedobacter sp.]|nr:MAG: c-type cytochrome [Pedobacter sp.]
MKALKLIIIVLGIVVLFVVAAGTYIKTALPDIGYAPKITINANAAGIENGRYLANHVTVCMDCHSSRNWTHFAGPIIPGTLGGGGEVFNQDMGFPGSYHAANITPYAIGNWTDGEIFRAVTSGVDKDGNALFPIMAAHRFGKMDRQDIYDIISYIRTLQPIKKIIPQSTSDFPVNFIINTMPKKAEFQPKPAQTDIVRYGGYLVNAAGCVDCHSRTEKGAVIEGTEFGGGMEFKQPAGILRSPNITFDKLSGIGSWTEDTFTAKFKAYADSSYKPQIVAKGEMNTVMPWTMYGGMTSNDLKAIYAYLQNVKKIANTVERFTPAGSK